MLEHQHLLLLPWSVPEEANPATRDILDHDTGSPLGHAWWKSCRAAGWFGIFCRTGPTVEVRETEDDSLLFTMHASRPWQFLTWNKAPVAGSIAGSHLRWEIRDADGYMVGTLEPSGRSPYAHIEQAAGAGGTAAGMAYDLYGRCVIFSRQNDGTGRVVGKEIVAATTWTEIGTLSCSAEGGGVHFSAALEGQPFAKMLILAAAIVRDYCSY
jgi:hypothetical protein